MQLGQNSAKIYQFPTGGRDTVGAGRANAGLADLLAADVAVVEFGCGWYHDEAIEEEAAKTRQANRPTAEIRPFARH
ncbi:DUF2735 domain-containing protein [Methylopila sp. M107]|uniref:DUF2735 domain-containing protein n=1 Tax=Methylopila sp. M107 TaxID=1101190 RepID=UPI00036A49BE|nr:DUF2735 domain-containing protein [Methylopila sp. M107]